MKLPKLSWMFAKAIARSRETEEWVDDKRDFVASLDGVDVRARARVQVIVSSQGASRRRVTGEVIVQMLAVAGERVEAEPGWIHFVARDGAIVEPEPLFALAAAEAVANLRGNGAFRACCEMRAISATLPEAAPARKRARL